MNHEDGKRYRPTYHFMLPAGWINDPNLESLRGEPVHVAGQPLELDSRHFVEGVQGACLEVEAEFTDWDEGATMGLSVLLTADGDEETYITWEADSQILHIGSLRNGGQGMANAGKAKAASLPLDSGEPLRLRVFVDKSLVEVHANERVYLTHRVYPVREDSLHVGFFVQDGEATLSRLTVWPLRPLTFSTLNEETTP